MMLGPKVTVITKYGAKMSLRYSLFLWLFDRKFANNMKRIVQDSWDGDYDTMTFRSHGSKKSVLRIGKHDVGMITLSWF